MEDSSEAECDYSGRYMSDQSPADYAEVPLRENVEVEEEEGELRYGDGVLDEALEYEKE